MRDLLSSVFLILASTTAYAQAPAASFTVKEVRTQVILSLQDQALKFGDVVSASLPSGEQCNLRVVQIVGDSAITEVVDCPKQAAPVVAAPTATPQAPLTEQVASADAPPPLPEAAPSYQTRPFGRNLSDLQYLPRAGVLYNFGTWTNMKAKSSHHMDPSRDLLLNVDTSQGGLQFGLGFGITDQVAFQLSTSYRQTSEVITSGPIFGSASSTTKTSGFTDPIYKLIWRAIEKSDSLLDLSFAYSPKTTDKFTSSSTYTGNEVRGGDLVRIEAEYSRPVSDQIQVRVAAELDILHDRSFKNSIGTVRTDLTGGSSFDFSGQAQYDFVSFASVYGGLGLTRQGELTQQSPSSKVTMSSFVYWSARAGVKVEIGENLVVDLSTRRSFETTATVKGDSLDGAQTMSSASTVLSLLGDF